MLVLCSKILVILVLAQYVTSVEFYKSKRVPPKYKEIRRTYSLKEEENVDSTPADTFLEKNTDRDTSIGNIETTDDNQPSFTTILTNDNGGTIDYPLKKNEEKDKTEPVEADVNNNSDQAKESIDNIQSTENEQTSFTTTVKPKRRPFNLRKKSKSSEIDINVSNDRDKVSIEKIQTTNKKQFSLTTSTIMAKRRNFNLRPIRNKGDKAPNKPLETFVKDNIDKDEEIIDDKQITEEKKPVVSTTTIKPKRRFSHLRTLKNRREKVQTVPATTSDIVNTNQDKVSNGNLQTIREEIPVATTRKMKPLRRTLNVYSLKRKEEKTDSKISSGNVQTTEDEKVIITTSTVRAKTPTTLGLKSNLKKKEQGGDSKFLETVVDEDTYQDEVSNIQVIGDKKPNVITSTVKPESPATSPYSLKREEGNTDGETLEALIKENAEQGKVAIDNIQVIKEKKPIVSTSTINPKTVTLSPQLLHNEEEYIDSEYIEKIVNENTGQIKVSLDDVKSTRDKKLSVTARRVKPTTSTSSLYSLKKETDNKSVKTVVQDNTGQIELPLDTLKTTGDNKLSLSLNKDTNVASDVTLLSKKTGQNEESIGNLQATGEKKVTVTTSTIKPRRRTLSLSSLKRKEVNPNTKPVSTQKTDRDQVTTSNERTTGEEKLRVTTSTVKPKTSTSSLYSLKKETDNKSVKTVVKDNTGQTELALDTLKTTGDNKLSLSLNKDTNVESGVTLFSEKTAQNEESIGNLQATEGKKDTVTTSTIKPRRRTLSLSSLKRKEVNPNTKPVSTQKTDRDQVTTSNERTTGEEKLRVTTSTVKPKTSTSSLYSLKKETDNKSVKTVVQDNTGQIELPLDTFKTTGDNKLSLSLNKDTNVASDVTLLSKKTGQNEESIGNLQATGEKKVTVTTSTIKPRRRTLSLSSLKRKEVNPNTKPVSTQKTDRDQVTTSNERTTGEEKLRVTTSTVKPKTSTSSLYSLKKETDNKSVKTVVKDNTGQTELALDTLKTTGDNKLSLSLNKDTNVESGVTLFSEKTAQNEESIGNLQATGGKKDTVTTSTIKPRRRTLSLSSLKRKEVNPNTKPVSTQKTDRDQVTTSNERTTGEEKLRVTTSTVKPKTSTSSLYSLKKETDNKSVKTVVQDNTGQIELPLDTFKITGDNKLSLSLNLDTKVASVETIVNKNTGQNEESTGNVQATGEKKVTITTSSIKPRRRTLSLSSLKRKEEHSDTKPVSTQKTDQDQVTTSNGRTTGEEKLRVITSTVKPKTSTSSLYTLKKETDDKSVKTFVKDNTGSIELALDTLKITGDNKLSLSLNKDTNVASVETIVNENIGRNKVSIGNVQATRENKVTVTTTAIKPRTRTPNIYPLKRKEENSQNKPIATPVNENTDQYQVTTSDLRANGNQKLSVTSRIMKPQRLTSNLNYLKKTEENTSSKPIETFVNENIRQEKASTGDLQNSGDKKFRLISSTIEPKRLTVNLDSLKINEDNTKSKSVDTFVSKNFGHEKISIDNLQSEQATINEEANSNISTKEPEILTVNSAISDHGSKRIIKTQRKIVVKNTDEESKLITISSVSNKDGHMKVVAAQAPQSYENYFQTTTPYTKLEKTTQNHDNFVPIVGVHNYVYAYNGDYHYSYEGGDGTKAFERGELKSADGSSNSSGVVGGYSYKDKDGNVFNLSYTAGEGGYQPVGAHLPTSPPIPPAIQRVLRILATKTTPEPITERIKSDH